MLEILELKFLVLPRIILHGFEFVQVIPTSYGRNGPSHDVGFKSDDYTAGSHCRSYFGFSVQLVILTSCNFLFLLYLFIFSYRADALL